MSKKRFWLVVLGLVGIGLVFSHVRWIQQDGRHLLDIDGRKVDLLGLMKDQVTALTRDCRAVIRLGSDHPDHLGAMEAIRAYSLPHSATGQIVSAWSSADWLLIEVEFTDLLPAVVALNKHQHVLQIVPQAIWSGSIHPWKAAPLIRDYIARQAPDITPNLLACYEPQSKYFKG